MKDIITKINSTVKPGTFGITLVTETIVRMPKKNNPLWGRATKRSVTSNAQLGISYKSQVENRSESTEEFQPQKHSGCHHFDKFFDVSDRNPDQFYLRVGYRDSSKVVSTIFVDGREATKEEIEFIKSFQEPQPTANTQIEYGVKKEVVWRTYKTESIVEVSVGNRSIYKV
jgi:hypothetical protein